MILNLRMKMKKKKKKKKNKKGTARASTETRAMSDADHPKRAELLQQHERRSAFKPLTGGLEVCAGP